MQAVKRGAGGSRLQVWKFGGASLADAGAVRRAVGLVHAHRGPAVIVVSALGGITDLLLDGARRALAGDVGAPDEVAAEFSRRHRAIVAATAPRCAHRALFERIEQAAGEYREIARAVATLRDFRARASDTLVSRGEQTAAAVVAAALGGTGTPAEVVDPVGFILTDGRFGSATPDLALTRHGARRAILPLLRRGTTPVVPGFIGAGPDGSLVTLGRGGSDLTATLLARCLGAARVVLWKDVAGILTADPRLVPDARLIPELHRREAAEVAFYGGKVLHPRALIPLDRSPIVLDVRSFLEPDRPGTQVSGRASLPRYPVKAVATIGGQALVTVAGRGMIGVPGIAGRTFEAVHAAGLSVSTIFQASSESSIGFTLSMREAARAVSALRRAFREELASGLIDAVASREGLAVVAVVGSGMAGTPGIAARVFSALASGGVNVIAIAQGSSELNITFVVTEAEAAEATRRVHAAFQLAKIGGGRSVAPSHTDVVMLGFGKVGRALADQIAAPVGGLPVRMVGLMDRSGFVFDPKGLSRRRLMRLAEQKDRGQLVADLGGVRASAAEALARIASHAVSRPILVDVTAEETGDLLCAGLKHGFDLVLANKRPVGGSQAAFERLVETARRAGRRLRFEATVGAGLPVIDTFAKLVESGDRVIRIEGCVSGTLGFVFSAISSGQSFSSAVREAVERGYAEPDPREDLSGRDAARKGLILGRLMGYRGGAAHAEDLTPPAFRRVPPDEFLARLPELDACWKERADRAARAERVLRYVVVATRTSVRASLLAVPRDSALGSLRGTRNLISFTTRRYREEPLVVMGPGAGPDVTASGILNDIHRLAATSTHGEAPAPQATTERHR